MSTFRDEQTPGPTLTLGDLRDLFNRRYLLDQLVYSVSDALSPGKVIMVEENDLLYACCIFHSQEEAQGLADACGLTLLHLADAPSKPIPEEKVREALEALRQALPPLEFRYEPEDDLARPQRRLWGYGRRW